jgi:hypothetical protein
MTMLANDRPRLFGKCHPGRNRENMILGSCGLQANALKCQCSNPGFVKTQKPHRNKAFHGSPPHTFISTSGSLWRTTVNFGVRPSSYMQICEKCGMLKRGKFLFIFLASLIVVNEATNILFSLSRPFSEIRWVTSIFLPMLMIWSAWELWKTGNKATRWTFSGLIVLKGISLLFAFGYVAYRLFKEIPPESLAELFWFPNLMVIIPILYSIMFIVVGISLFCIPSINAFLDSRSSSSASHF